jgi:CheY-like chemotaxis protein
VTVLKDRGMAFSLGASDFMTKPVDRSSLMAMLRRYSATRSGGVVLLVDDDEACRDTTRRVVEKLGLQVAEAVDGLDAMRWLGMHAPPALILLDLMMPIMDGFEFLARVQPDPKLRGVPIVVLTAKQLTLEEINQLTGSTERVMTKDATSNVELGAAIRRCLERHGTAAPTEEAEPASA